MTRRGVLAGLAVGLSACSEPTPPQVLNPPAEPIPAPFSPPPMQSAWPSLDAQAKATIAAGLAPGLSLTVMRNGMWLYSKGFGLANISRNATMTPQTMFRIGSVSKQFTAAAIMMLSEQRMLALTDPLALYLPQFPRAAEITIAQLLSHTSGLGDYLAGVYPVERRRSYSTDELLAAIAASRPLFEKEPGTAWHYSNSGFALLGIVIEKVSGLSFRDFCTWRLFAEAGLHDTRITTAADPAVCVGYYPDFRAPGGFRATQSIPPSLIGGAGAISSTTEDLCRWHAILMSGKVLQPASFRAMQTPVRSRGGSLTPNYGLGLTLGRFGGTRFIAHSGLVNGFTAHLRTFPDQRLTVAALYNSDGGGVSGFAEAKNSLHAEASSLGLAVRGPGWRS